VTFYDLLNIITERKKEVERESIFSLSINDEHPSNIFNTNSQHKNPLCRVASIDSINEKKEKLDYDKEKYKEMILDAAETVLGYFGFDRT
jgi:hypothetical protein